MTNVMRAQPLPGALMGRPKNGDTVRDRAGTRYLCVSVGMKYANVEKVAEPGKIIMVKLTDVYQEPLEKPVQKDGFE